MIESSNSKLKIESKFKNKIYQNLREIFLA